MTAFITVSMEQMKLTVRNAFATASLRNLRFFFFQGPNNILSVFTPIYRRLWPHWERLFSLSFAWVSSSTYSDGRAQLTVKVPHAISTWIVSAFSISQQHGLALLPAVVAVSKTVSEIFES